MNGRTVCPACHSVFRVDDTQLAAAEGWVQCGVCGEAFDARAALRDITPPPEPELPAPVVELETEPEASAPPIPLGVPLADSAEAEAPLVEPVPYDPFPAPEPNEESPGVPAPPSDAAEETEPARPEIPPQEPEPEPASSITRSPSASPPPLRQSTQRQPGAPRPHSTPRWGMWAALLFILLLAQGVWHGRTLIVGQWPEARPLYETLCQSLGCSLPPVQKEGAVTIVGSELQDGAEAGRYRLGLTLGNHAAQAQPWPTLVVALLDRQQQVYSRRRFAPTDYQPDAAVRQAGLPPVSESSLTLELATLPPWPAGYRLELAW